MMKIKPEISGVSIVLVGSFNPPIFHPEWFERHGLINDKEKEAAEIAIIHRQIAAFRMEWLAINIEPVRFVAETQEGPFIRLADFVVKTFKDYLYHTPIGMMGINRQVHFSVGSEEERNRIGKMLAPHEGWGEWGKDLEGKSPKKRGGMISLTMLQQDLDDRKKGYIKAKIEPSNKIKDNAGIDMEVNDHYEVENPAQNQDCKELMDILESKFDNSIKHSEWIIDQIMKLTDIK
ncbi:conserved hypothetical protein [uncultured Desulfobacterium sp.]|uniref:TIGR04255 family protein n=1 Tax=uncultured Desulfobacterium sp. TaxID=201089 RepID=A0A445N3M9_9BACT|nr:conserved hypothetical protein [uncultured Desulfobacterium sp.]